MADGGNAEQAALFAWAAHFAATADDELPDDVVQAALTIMCDDVAAMIAAQDEPEVSRLTDAAAEDRSAPEATVIGRPNTRVPRRRAGVANAIAANWTELDGGYRPATCHGSLYTLPTALAEVEARHGTVGDLLRGLVVGYETCTRIARVYRPPVPLVRHPHASLSPIGAAAALGAVRRLPSDQFAQTVLAAASMSLTGPFSHATQGATVRNVWAGAGVELGHLAADTVAAGVTASRTVFDDVFAHAHTSAVDYAAFTAELGERFAVEDGYQKSYACCQYLHSTVEAAGQLAGVPAAEIVGIEVCTHPLAVELDNREPETTLAGRFSLPHAVATVLAHGSTGVAVFAADVLRDPDIARLRRLVTIETWQDTPEPPHDRPATVRIRLRDGSTRESTVWSAAGGPDRPLTRADLVRKFSATTGRRSPGFADAAAVVLDPATRPSLDDPLRDVVDQLLTGERA